MKLTKSLAKNFSKAYMDNLYKEDEESLIRKLAFCDTCNGEGYVSINQKNNIKNKEN